MKINSTYLIKSIIAFAFIFALQSNVFAQEKEEKESEEKPRNSVGFSLNHAHVFEGRNEFGEKESLSLPSFSLDYNYNLSKRWSLGLHTDIIVEKFKVEHESENGTKEELERSYPVAPALMGIYHASEHWSFLLGMGAEFAKEENFTLTRAGVEYGAEIRKGWEVYGALAYDFKWNAYDTWTLGIGISKSFGKTK
ncbi:hypothetical protein [Pedobacter sp. MW01-1-1]|uniref:hypothetical protein n=1 Tax=Pedobacter sp. MW01-1-1 TaxID=3383027 RepID=UPI003FF0DC8B